MSNFELNASSRYRRVTDPLALAMTRIEDLERKIRMLESTSQPTQPQYDPSSLPPNLLDGQMWIDDNLMAKYRAGGATHPLGGRITQTFPSTPSEGDITFYKYNDGTTWQFFYDASGGDIYKWHFVGGPWATYTFTGPYNVTSASWTNLLNVATAPFSGYWEVFVNCRITQSKTSGYNAWLGFGHNGTIAQGDLYSAATGTGTGTWTWYTLGHVQGFVLATSGNYFNLMGAADGSNQASYETIRFGIRPARCI